MAKDMPQTEVSEEFEMTEASSNMNFDKMIEANPRKLTKVIDLSGYLCTC